MDINQPTGETTEPGSGGMPPQPPYQPPAQPPYQPPSQPPYQQPVYPGGYQAPPPPPPRQKGFNWLACCGITCLVLLIVGGGMAFCTYRMVKPFVGMTTELASLGTELKTTDIATIKATAEPVDEIALSTSPDQYTGRWLEFEGELSNNSFSGTAAFSSGDFSTDEYTNYVIRNILVMDVDKSPPVGNAGDRIRAYGKAYSIELATLESIPFVGKPIVDELRKDPMLAGQDTMVFFLCKGIERIDLAVDEAVDDGAAGEPAGEPTSEDGGASEGNGWVR